MEHHHHHHHHERMRRKATGNDINAPGGARCRCCRVATHSNKGTESSSVPASVQVALASSTSALSPGTVPGTAPATGAEFRDQLSVRTRDVVVPRMKVPCQANNTSRKKQDAMLYTLRAKGRTPDWIAGIFSITRRGNLERLSQVLEDMDATLIRNLSDHRGNNLLHVCCCYGHLECLQWLLRRGQQCQDAILDENKYELTPLVCAVKYGKLPCVEWLVTNTIARGQLTPTNGSRPLLHWAARYGQETILKWLTKYMEDTNLDANVKDGHGNTALHLAAKHGHALSIKALMSSRCDVTIKNELGYKPSDYALLYGQAACSEYLMSMEACLILSNDVANSEHELSNAKTEMVEMKAQFKEVLSCSKKLVKEREELAQHLERLTDGLNKLSTRVMAQTQALSIDFNSSGSGPEASKDRMNGSQLLDDTVALCQSLLERCQEGQQRWLSPSSLADFRQRVILAEDRWKRARARHDWGETDAERHMNIFRERLMQVQCWASGIRLSDVRSISSSESSLASMEDTTDEYEYEDTTNTSYPNDAYWQSPPGAPCDCRHISTDEPPSPKKSLAPILCSSTPRVNPAPRKQPSQVTTTVTTTTTKKQGTCSLLEILEPSSSDNDEAKPQSKSRKTKHRSRCVTDNSNWHSDQDDSGGPSGHNPGGGRTEAGGEEPSPARYGKSSCGTTTVSPGSGNNTEEQTQKREAGCPEVPVTARPFRVQQDAEGDLRTEDNPSPVSNYDGPSGKLMSSEPDLIIGMRIISKPETGVGDEIAATSAPTVPRDTEDPAEAEDMLGASVESRLLLPEYVVADGAECDVSALHPGSQHIGGISKKKGFLQKLSLRWPSKRKLVDKTPPHKKVHEITPEDFRETYLHTFRNGMSDRYSDAEGSSPRQIHCVGPDGDWDLSKHIPRLMPPDPGNIVLESQENPQETEAACSAVASARTSSSEVEAGASTMPEADSSAIGLHLDAQTTTNSDVEADTETVVRSQTNPSSFTPDTSMSGVRSHKSRPTVKSSSDEGCRRQESLSPPPPPPPPSSSSKAADSRPESSASLYRVPGYPLSKTSSVSTDMLLLPTLDCAATSRMSPAPSEVSKTESTLSPPSDVSKTESLRHLRQLARIEESISMAGPQAVVFPLRKFVDVRRAAIVGIHGAPTGGSGASEAPTGTQSGVPDKDAEEQKTEADQAIAASKSAECSRTENASRDRKGHLRSDKPWYEMSDDEEILMPETLNTSTARNRSSSEEDELYCCA